MSFFIYTVYYTALKCLGKKYSCGVTESEFPKIHKSLTYKILPIFLENFVQAFIISISVPTLVTKIWGPLPFWAVFFAIEQFKITIFVVCGIANVSAIMQLLLLVNFE